MSKTAVMLYSALGHAYFHMFTAFYFVIVLSLEIEWQQPYHDLIELWTPGALLVGVFAIVAGWLGDKWSAHGMLVVYFIGMGLCSIAAGYATSPLSMILALAGLGLFASIYHPIGIPLVIRNSGANRGKVLAFNGLFGSLGAAMAGAVTGLLVDLGGSFLAFVLPGAIVAGTGVVMLVTLRLRRASRSTTTSQPTADYATSSAPRRQWMPLLVLLFCLTAAGLIYHATQTAMPKAFSVRLTPGVVTPLKAVGFYVTLVYIISGLFQFVGGALADRYNLKLVYLYQFIVHGVLLLAAAHAGGLYLVVVLCATASLASGALPAENMLLAKYTPSKHHGLMFGLKFVLFFVSGPVGIILVSTVTQQTGQFTWVFLWLAITAMFICLAALALPRRSSGNMGKPPDAHATA